ncbi:MAG TPA: RdgB/HAM1 family non-canonical purine NTP pyrophosphatase [Gaiellales bacterium]|nr:RdgB/HAM1 family non-canonical purine NTP pyrophosphatase [Gaiellales bacterium]
MRIVLASGNAHKARELGRLLEGWDVETFAGELPEETGQTFVENARLKARHVHAALGGGEWVLADDSGIEAAALGGVPGVRSARYAGEDATDEQNLAKLIGALDGADDRRVRYVAELVAIGPGGGEVTARGELAGTLAAAPRGTGGFGYDPAFVPDGESRTVAEMSPDEKDAVSHRARAARALREKLGSDPNFSGEA